MTISADESRIPVHVERTTAVAANSFPDRPFAATHRFGRLGTAILSAVVMTASMVVMTAPAATSDVLSGADSATLGREPQITPADLGVDPLDGLQYPDPAEGLDLIAPPEADPQGGASVSHPLSVPRGRAGVEPDLALTYDSSGGNGWVGVGWDLSLGAVEVDTRWGVPLMCPAGGVLCGPEGQRNVESETYLLDGDVLHPTAVRSQFQPRVADRADWVRRTETEWERIIRHGNHPSSYWWEVTDKSGTTRYYGGRPDGTRDESAILSSTNGAVRWGLSAVVDISGNLMTVSYAKPQGSRVGTGSNIGTGFYVKEITYTGSTKVENSPAYRIKFRRDGDVGDATPRLDVVVDASAGTLEVTSDLLRRIEVVHGAKQSDGSRGYSTAAGGKGILVKAWDLHYKTGPFDKSLLTKIDQVGGDDAVGASHTFDYYDEVKFASGAYEGFAGAETWRTRRSGNDLSQALLAPVGLSALGASETNGGGARAYLGFNPTSQSKTGSFGGSFAVNGGGTEALIEMIDLNGDQLPDKVFRTSLFDRTVKYRLSNGDGTFGDAQPITGLTRLSSEDSIGVSGGPEAYFGASVAFNIAFDVSIGAAYFEDVNNDGRADYVSDGEVLFNTPTSTGGVKFVDRSDGTAVPVIRGADVQIDEAEAVRNANETQRAMSPLQDVVRRWVAPWKGVVAVTGDVTFVPPDLDPGEDPLPTGGTPYTSDGVRVAIQQHKTERWSARLTTKGQTVTPTGVGALEVEPGQELWFRVGSVEDGVRDRVEWEPVVTYTQVQMIPGGPLVPVDDTLATDENGLAQDRFDAAAEFTLAGRPGTPVLMPLRGTVQLEGALTKSARTSDDVTLIVEKDGVVVVEELLAADFVGTVNLEENLEVDAPTDDRSDQLIVRVAADSSVDPTMLDFRPRLYYTEAFDAAGDALPTTQDLLDNSTGRPGADGIPDVDRDGRVVRLIQVDVPWDIDIYPHSDRIVPLSAWEAERSGDATVSAKVTVSGDSPAGDAILTVKRRRADGQPGELVAKRRISLPSVSGGVATRDVDLDAEFEAGEKYWFDLTVRDPVLHAQIASRDVRVTWAGSTVEDDVEETLRWAGSQGVFPIAHRGWAYAGYKAEGRVDEPIEREAFVLDVDLLPKGETKPIDFDDGGFPDVSQRDSFPFVPALVDVRLGTSVASVPVWQGSKESIHGAAGSAQSSRTAADQANIVPSVAAGGSQQAPVKVGLTAPGLGLTLGLSAAGVSLAAGPSFGLLDYVDMNGDSFPDYVSPEQVAFTGPTGGYLGTRSLPLAGPGVGADLTFGVSAGFNGSAIELKGSATGDANTPEDAPKNAGHGGGTTSGGAATTGGPSDKDEAGVNVGGSLDVTAQFTNPVATPPGKDNELAKIAGRIDTGVDARWEWELADINGDGLPDRISAGPGGVKVRFNLGYSFTDEVPWASGAFEGSESFSGEVGGTRGFNWNKREFSGGLALSEAVDLVRWTWDDIDGDGVLDQIHKNATGRITVAFGSGAGVGPAKPYGSMQTAEVNLVDGEFPIPTGQQPSSNRSSGVGGGVDFTIPVGPLCLPAKLCYLIINPGFSFERSLSSSEVQLVDVDGDGAPDSVKSTADGAISIRSNLRGRTNLLKSVTNPLGGQIRIGYERDGNTEEQPNSIWVMSSVEVDDGREVPAVAPDSGKLDSQQGDGPDVQVSTFTYAGNRYDPVEREIMGYTSVIEEQRDGGLTTAVLRKRVTKWDNETVFTAGLVRSEELRAPDDTLLQRTVNMWGVVDVASGESKPVSRPNTSAEALALLRETRGVVLQRAVEEWYSGGSLATSTRVDFEHDALGNVVRQVDRGLPTTPADDLIALTTYSDCRDSSWVSVPATFTITAPDGTVLRHRDGSTDLCLNGVPTELVERIDDNTDAVTTMHFDDWGSYDQIAYPENANGERYTVTYTYDDDRRTDVAHVIDSHGLEATAKFDEAGMVTERADANGNKTTYGYDGFGRLASVRAPDEQSTTQPTVAYEYFPTADGYAYAIARHRDRFAEQPSDTIDTATFVDGLGRITQTKHDASIVQLDEDGESRDDPAADEVIVSGFVKFDALGRQAAEWWPRTEPKGSLTTFQQVPAEYLPSVTTYDLRDQVTSMLIPSGDDGKDEFLTTFEHGFTSSATPDIPAGAFFSITKDALLNDPQRPAGEPVAGKVQRTWEDARGNLLAFEDDPEGAPAVRTRYSYDRLGQLLRVVDNAGNVTTHSYDGLGRRLSSEMPDAGLRSLTYDPAGNVVTEVTSNLRRDDEEIRYQYEFDRLARIDYPGTMTDVEYTYGAPGAAENGAGRLIEVTDAARFQTLGYDALGAVARETTTMRTHNLNPETRDKLTFTTLFDLDSFGRMATVTYPDGEVLRHEYDSGGLLSGLEGTKACTELASLAAAVDEVTTTLIVTDVASTTPDLPFTVRIDGEEMLVTGRVEVGDGTVEYTVKRGVNGTEVEPTAASHAARAKVISAVAVSCTYRYLDYQEYDEFEDRRTRGTGNEVDSITSFDFLGRLERIQTDTPDRRVQDINLTYDKADNVTEMLNDLPDPVPNLPTGYTAQEYTYDEYYRLVSATGEAGVAPDKVRTFTWDVTYDKHGNVIHKQQVDQIATADGKGKPLVQKPTTYTFDMRYLGTGPHQLTSIGPKTYSYDANGNLTGWIDPVTNQRRIVTWDAEDRITRIDDGSDATDYKYDAAGNRAIERGPDGETSFVNRWYTVRNGSVPWKQIWAGDDRLATKRSIGGSEGGDYEHMVYYLHKDLQGSTNVVTDRFGKVFEHYEYFPGGEAWIKEDSNVHRTYWMYGGGYFDEVRQLINFGARWYEPREGIFYSPDPLLHSDPSAAIGDPALLPAYTYAGSNPISYVDPAGHDLRRAGSYLRSLGFGTVGHATGPWGSAAIRSELAKASPLWSKLYRFALSEKAEKLQAFSDRWDAKPLISISLNKGPDGLTVDSVKISPFGFGLEKEVYKAGADQKKGTTQQAPPPGSPQVQPGSGSAVATSGPASVGSGGSGPDKGTRPSGSGASALPSAASPPRTGGMTNSSSNSSGGAASSAGKANGPPDTASP